LDNDTDMLLAHWMLSISVLALVIQWLTTNTLTGLLIDGQPNDTYIVCLCCLFFSFFVLYLSLVIERLRERNE